jgi:hypothetical protein
MVKPNINKADFKPKHATKGRKLGKEKTAMLERAREKEKKK